VLATTNLGCIEVDDVVKVSWAPTMLHVTFTAVLMTVRTEECDGIF
jgi:hypothetical protein